MSPRNETLLWAIDVVRRYAPDPLVDYHEEEPAEQQSAEEFFLSEMSPSDEAFR